MDDLQRIYSKVAVPAFDDSNLSFMIIIWVLIGQKIRFTYIFLIWEVSVFLLDSSRWRLSFNAAVTVIWFKFDTMPLWISAVIM